MKLFVSAIALAFAVPAAAQAAPAQPTPSDHAGHQMPKGQDHDGHAMKDGCCADKDGNGKMDCCEKMAVKKDDPPTK